MTTIFNYNNKDKVCGINTEFYKSMKIKGVDEILARFRDGTTMLIFKLDPKFSLDIYNIATKVHKCSESYSSYEYGNGRLTFFHH